jgi:hypothetical protein
LSAKRGVRLCLALASLAAAAAQGPSASGDPEAADQAYRAALRLAGKGSGEAAGALRRVLELDPEGVFADDALVELAHLESPPRWPEGIGVLDPGAVARALAHLDEALRRFPAGDRAAEAEYHRALLLLEPVASYARAEARARLAAVATGGTRWSGAARYALAWLHECEGDHDRAFDGYQRLLVDAPADDAGVRARVGSARVLLRRGEHGTAARRLQEALDAGVAPDAGALALRELAVRALLQDAGAPDPSRPVRLLTGVRTPSAVAPTAGGGALVVDPRQGRVIELGPEGDKLGEWPLEEPQGIVADAAGRCFAAAADTLYRLDRGRAPLPLASLGDYAPLAGLATDGAGGFWLLERRGRRIGRIEPGASGPVPHWEGAGVRLTGLAWNGEMLVAIDGRRRDIVAVEHGATLRTLVERTPERFVALAADATGRIALFDARTSGIWYLRGAGRLEPAATGGLDLSSAVGIGLGPEGELHVLDRDGAWTVLR